jgi:organic radical activating enzyme
MKASSYQNYTESLCPVCLARIPARVVDEGNGVWLEHNCPTHGLTKSMIECDADFYGHAIASSHRKVELGREANVGDILLVFPTYRCNINCNVCYVPRRDPSMDMSMEEISAVIDKWPGRSVMYAGGEPTVLENLPAILSMTRAKGKLPAIVTNGVRIADKRYLAELIANGLRGVSLSLNAMDRKTLESIDGRDWFDAKMQAIANLKKIRQRFIICFTLVRNINEGEFGKVLKFALSQYPFCNFFHAECLPGIGRGINDESVYLSEMADLLASALGLPRKYLVNLAESGKASMGPYSYGVDYQHLLSARIRSGVLSGATELFRVATLGIAGILLGLGADMRLHLQAGPRPDTVDLGATPGIGSLMTTSRESPMLELWEYLIRFHGARENGHRTLNDVRR